MRQVLLVLLLVACSPQEAKTYPEPVSVESSIDGEAGASGRDGLDGVDGLPGLPGPAGAQGLPGEAGPIGLTGSPGPTGPAGEPGEEGPIGPQGEQGIQGAPGLQGPPGAGSRIVYEGTTDTTGRATRDIEVYEDDMAIIQAWVYSASPTARIFGTGWYPATSGLADNGQIKISLSGVSEAPYRIVVIK